MTTVQLKVAFLLPNTGQLPGVPTNPRTWTEGDVSRLAKSLQETPELFEARPIIVTPLGNKFVILGGNLRHAACKKAGIKTAPCAVIPEGTPADKMKEIVLKDNGSFGAWDFDALANEWDDLPLVEWGVPAWDFSQMKENAKKESGEINLSGINPSYSVQVDCASLEEQLELIKELDGRGYKCKSL